MADSCAAPRLRQLFDALEGAALRLCVLAYVVGKEMPPEIVISEGVSVKVVNSPQITFPSVSSNHRKKSLVAAPSLGGQVGTVKVQCTGVH